jgi:hypothetical protein
MNRASEAFSNAEKQLPPRVSFYMELERLHRDFSAQITEAITKADNPDNYSEPGDLMVNFDDQERQPITIGKADSAEFSILWSSMQDAEDLPFTILSMYLYGDSSPYVFPEDYEEGLENNLYKIYATAEMPPFIVSNDRMDKYYAPGVRSEFEKYLEAVQENKEQLRYLSDEECTSIINALKNKELDIEDALKSNLID